LLIGRYQKEETLSRERKVSLKDGEVGGVPRLTLWSSSRTPPRSFCSGRFDKMQIRRPPISGTPANPIESNGGELMSGASKTLGDHYFLLF
jgi:hypothetical protein